MKRVMRNFFFAVAIFMSAIATAEAQNSFAYQAVIRTAKGELVSNQKVGMKFSLIHDGKVVYSETHAPETNQYGNVQVEVGKGQNATGDFAKVPWNTMQVMMKIEADPNGGTNYIDLGTIQLQPAPYAMYAPLAGEVNTVQAGDPKSDSDALFEVKDKDGNVVFAVYPDGVRVFVNDEDTASKVMPTGFAVSGRKAAKEGEEANIFAVNAAGTQVFVGEGDTTGSKVMPTGFAVSGRKAAKDGSDLFTVGSTGTQVYIDPDSYRDATKAISTGFAVSGRKAAKGEEKYLEINADGTRVYVDDADSDKPIQTGFAVSGRKAAKGEEKILEINAEGTKIYVGSDGKVVPTGFAVSGRKAAKGKEIKLFEVNSYGTQIYIDTENDNDKVVPTGFAVSGRKAAKDGTPDKYMVIDADGTVIYVDYEEAKAMQTGFAVSGRKAAKDGTQNTILKVDNTEGTRVYIEDVDGKVMPTGFAVSGRKAAKEGETDLMRVTGDNTTITAKNLDMLNKESEKNMMSITSNNTQIYTDELQLLNTDDDAALSTGSGNVEVMNDLVVMGDVAQTVDADTVENARPIRMLVQKIDTIAIADSAPALKADKGYALLKIYGKGKFTVNENQDPEKNDVMLFSAAGNLTTFQSEAVVAVIMTKAATKDAKLIIWPLKAVANDYKINFGLMAAGDTANRYVNVEAFINVTAPVECLVDVKAEVDSLGTVAVVGPKVYGEKVDILATPIEGYHFTNWSDGRRANPRTALILHDTAFASANFEINTYKLNTTAENGKIEISVEPNADTTFNHGTEIELTAMADEHYHFMGWTDGEAAAKREFKIKSDTAFEATFAIDSFKIATLAENGEVTGAGTYAYGTEIELVATPDTLNGFHFVNWSDGNTDNPRKLTITQDSTFTANFTKNTYALTYIVDGKIDGEIKMVEYEAELTLRKDSVRQGYTFSGWTYNGKNEKPKTMPKGNLTVTGAFTIKDYTISYNLNGGSLNEGETNYTSYTVETKDIKLNNPSKKGYSFIGWTGTGLQSATMDVTIAKGSTEPRSYTANWNAETYNISYDLAGGSLNSGVINPTDYTIETEDIKLNNPTKKGYNFRGWTGTDLQSATMEVTIAKGSTEHRSYTATWTAETYAITYNYGNGTMPDSFKESYTVEDNVILPVPTMPYYSFNGWYDASGTLVEGWKAGDKTNTQTFTAQWEKSFENVEGFSNYGTTYGSRALNCYAQVTLQNYIACNHEVTQAEYKAVMGENPSRFNGDEGFEAAEGEIQSRRPVDSVSWFDAIYYCNLRSIAENLTPCYKVGNETEPTKWGYTPHNGDTIAATITCNFEVDGYRLPTEAEWEYIAIAGDNNLYNIDNYDYYYGDITSLWYKDNSDGKTHEMKKHAANDYGIYDLEGNVREWCWDGYLESGGWDLYVNYYGVEPDTCTNRVIRGGGWNSNKSDCDIFECGYSHPDARYGDCGFRVVRTAVLDAKCTITYNTSGGTLIEPHTVWNGYFISSLPVPSRENYAFYGWYLDDAYTISFDIEMGNNIVTQDITLYAKWIWYKDGIQYDITDANAKTCQISSVDQSYEGEFIIPEKVEIEGVDYTITRIGNGAFYNCSDITSISIPNTVTSIGERAFYFVEKEGGLTSLVIPNSVTSIGDRAFYGCRYLERITLPSGITSIGDGWFCDCWHLKSINGSEDGTIVIPEGITSIGSNAFRNCQYDLKSVIIPEGVTSISDHAFYDCHNLVSVSVPSSIEFVGSQAFPTYSNDQLPAHYNVAGDGAKYLGNSDNQYVVLMDGKSVTNLVIKDGCRFIYDHACSNLNGSALTSVQFPEGLKGIGEAAFTWGKIEGDINIPEGVTFIGYEAFFRCSKVQTISIPNTIESIGEEALIFAEDEYATLGENLYTQYDNALYLGNETNHYLCLAKATSKDITECTINSQCKFILSRAFSGCNSLLLDVPETVTSIAYDAFSGVRNINYTGPAGSATDTWGAIVRNGYTKDGFIYSSADRTILLGYFGSGTEVVIPNTVTIIGDGAFSGRTDITSVSIPDGVTEIGSGAFYGCTGIKSLTIPDGVVTINYDYNAGYAFEGVGNIRYNGSAKDYDKNNWGAATRNAFVFGDFIFEDDAHTKLIKYVGDGVVVDIPDGTVTIGKKVFNDCDGITLVKIPTTVESIGDYAFYSCSNLESVNLSSVKSIGSRAFSFCTKLTTLTIPESVESVGSEAFYYCNKLETVNILSSGTIFGSDAFRECEQMRYGYANFASYESLCSLKFEGSDGNANPLTWAHHLYIGGVEVTEVVIPDDITSIDRQTFFKAMNVTSVTIPSTVKSIGDEAFRGCNHLRTITIAEGVETFGYKAFNECSFSEFNIPASVTSIGSNAFDNCDYLNEIRIPATVKQMGSNIFYSCSSDLIIYCDLEESDVPEGWNSDWYGNYQVRWGVKVGENGVVYSVDTEKGTASVVRYKGEGDAENALAIPETITFDGVSYSVTAIGARAFRSNSDIVSISIPSTVTSIGDYAFYYCSNLTSIGSTSSVTSIGKDAFYYCTALASIDISSAESIGEYAFYNCSSLTSISIPLTATNIDNHAFSGCSALTSVTIPQGIESISYGMFGSCTSLASIEIPSSVTSIGGYAFYSCSSLATVAIPQGIESIDDGTFFDCTSLSSIEIPSSVTSIGVNAFASTALTSIVIPSSVTSISSWVFSGCENLKEVHFKNNTPIQNVHEDAFSGSTNNLTFYVPKGSADVYKNMSWASGHTVYEEDPLSQNMLYIEGDEVSRAIENSHVFIDGRTVTISNLYVSDHEVTQGEFNNVMLNNPSAHTGENLDNYPVENVTWYAAIAYCNKLSKLKGLDSAYTVNDKNGNITDWENFDYSKLPAEGESWIVVLDITKNGYRLPTEAEWEYLARGGSLLSTDTYSGSSTIGDVAWHGGNSGDNGGSDNPQTHEVKTKSPNALGIYDMSGNVWEWCWDWFGTIDTNTPATGVETGTVHVLRGGSFFNNVDNDEPANDELSVYYTDGLQNNPPRYGFRVVRTVTQP